MKLFQDYNLKTVFLKKEEELRKYINKFSKDEIMANDLEVLTDNCYQKFFIEPIVIFDEDYSKRNIIQENIKKCNPIWRNNFGREYINVDGVKIEFHFPFSGEPKLFKCYASTYTLSQMSAYI